MTEYSRMAKGNFTAASGQTSAVIYLPFQPDYVEVWNYTNIKTSGASLITRAWWDNNLTDTGKNPTMVEGYSSGTATIFDAIQSNGISTFAAGLAFQFGPAQQVVASTKGTTTSFQVTGHGYAVGDVVIFEGLYQSSITGMPQMANIPFSVTTVTDANNFVVTWNSNDATYTNLSGSPTGSKVYKVLYPDLYVPGVKVMNAITTGTTTTIKTTTPHNFETGQEVAFRVPSLWGTVQLNSLPDVLIPGQPIYGYVQSITDNFTFVVNINSSSYTAFTTYIAVSNVVGLTPPQVLAVGDVNTGGNGYTGGQLYPSPQFPTSTNRVATINGPAIRGAFVNNTRQGFVIGSGAPTVITGTTIVTSASQIYWHAYLHDYANP